MGVSGCGKSTIGQLLAERLEGSFIEGDDLHPAENIRKMSAGIPLEDADRMPWLDRIAREAIRRKQSQPWVVISCSALKAAYRERLRQAIPDLRVIFLRGSREFIGKRMTARTGHFMPAALLDSQFAALEEPRRAMAVDIGPPPAEIVREILHKLEQTQ